MYSFSVLGLLIVENFEMEYLRLWFSDGRLRNVRMIGFCGPIEITFDTFVPTSTGYRT